MAASHWSRLQPYYLPTFLEYRSRLRLKIGFWQHSDSDAISNRNRLLDAGWDNEASMQIYMMADAHQKQCQS